MFTKRLQILVLLMSLVMIGSVSAEVSLDGFLQGLFGGRLDDSNPTNTEFTASETRMQLRAEHYGDGAEFFGRLDFLYDGAVETPEYDWELREGYFKFRLGDNIDVKVGRQILTWGTGDLIFINDVFAKDYRSFFVGRDDQYLKAPQNAIRTEWYNKLGAFSLVWTPRFEPNRLPTGEKLSYYNPFNPNRGIYGSSYLDYVKFEVPLPDAKLENGEIAMRFNRQLGNFSSSLYFYNGFYKNPIGVVMVGITPMPFYPSLNIFGASIRGSFMGGVLWMEGGYFDSRDDENNDNPLIPNSTLNVLFGFERQIANNLTANIQWLADQMLDYEIYETQQLGGGGYVRDEIKHTITSRVTKLLNDELVSLSGFVFYSPSDEDWYSRLSVSYKYSDEVTLTAGANLFDGNFEATDFGQFQKNDNVYLKMTYGF